MEAAVQNTEQSSCEKMMTESEWKACKDPGLMLQLLRGKISDRKLRLFAVACCRRVPSLFPNEASNRALSLVEGYSDGRVDQGEFWSLLAGMKAEVGGDRMSQVLVMEVPAWWRIAMALRAVSIELVTKLAGELTWRAKKGEAHFQAHFLRDLIGNPFQSISVDPSWLTQHILVCAQSFYDKQSFDQLSHLADALEEAGSTDADILNHCRSAGPHVRGCWVVDLLLGKQ